MRTDPVCGMEVDELEVSDESVYEDESYYFCSPECKQQFDENPEAFLEEPAG